MFALLPLCVSTGGGFLLVLPRTDGSILLRTRGKKVFSKGGGGEMVVVSVFEKVFLY